jgi:hypothetical protein
MLQSSLAPLGAGLVPTPTLIRKGWPVDGCEEVSRQKATASVCLECWNKAARVREAP